MCTPLLGRHAITWPAITLLMKGKRHKALQGKPALFFYFSTSSPRRPSNMSEKGTLNEGRGLVLSWSIVTPEKQMLERRNGQVETGMLIRENSHVESWKYASRRTIKFLHAAPTPWWRNQGDLMGFGMMWEPDTVETTMSIIDESTDLVQ